MKRIFKYLFIVFSLFIFIDIVKANEISHINMDIYIDANGNAHITETWDAYLTDGTEGYKAYGNLGNATISNFKVQDGDKVYETLDDWDSSDSFDEKAYKAGISETSNGVELCWGISKYGHHSYTLTYDINGFVADLDDYQMVYWTLIPDELTKYTEKVYIKIYADQKFADTLDVWGYGNYGGYAYVYDGYIEMSNDNLKDDEYMTILVKFDKGTFNTTNVISSDFDTYYQMAEKGATHYDTTFDKIFGVLVTVFNIVFWAIIIFAIVKTSSNPSNGTLKLDFGETGSKVPKDTPMFRDIPCNKDIFRAYWVATNYHLVKKKEDFLGAMILKWLKDGIVKIENETKGTVFKKEETKIIFSEATFDNDFETKLYGYMKEASKDNVLESKEFEKWCSKHYSTILKWFDNVIDYETRELVKQSKITEEEKTSLGVFKSKVYKVDPSMMEEAKQMKGLKEFFNEFDNMSDKEAIEVMLWQEYLMYAQIFGLAEKVAKQFKKLYPNVITDYDYDSIIFIHSFSYNAINSATIARSRAESYSSGGGGFSSGGGGGGSFGGGGGGGFR